MLGFLFCWFIGQWGPKISCTKTQTLPNSRIPDTSVYKGHHESLLRHLKGRFPYTLLSKYFCLVWAVPYHLSLVKHTGWIQSLEDHVVQQQCQLRSSPARSLTSVLCMGEVASMASRGFRLEAGRGKNARHARATRAIYVLLCHTQWMRDDRKSQVRQCLDFCSAISYANVDQKSAVQKPKHCLTWNFLSALVMHMD